MAERSCIRQGAGKSDVALAVSAVMGRTIVSYAVALAAAAALLQWLEYRYLARSLSIELYLLAVAIGFVALGLWAGHRLTAPTRAGGPEFARNEAVVRSLGLSSRECEILELLASGESNKELARRLGISPNTVKTHVARLYEKLEVQKRVQAIEKARLLAIIP